MQFPNFWHKITLDELTHRQNELINHNKSINISLKFSLWLIIFVATCSFVNDSILIFFFPIVALCQTKQMSFETWNHKEKEIETL